MPFPWEQAIQAGVQIGGQYAQQQQANHANERQIGAAFDGLDKRVAALATARMRQQSVTTQELSEFGDALGQLEGFAGQYASVEYVARQWRDEQPRYVQILQALVSKLPANQAVATGAVTPVGVTQAPGPAQGAAIATNSSGIDTQTLLIVGALIGGFLLLRR